MNRSFVFLATLVFLIAGCAKPEAAFVGKWQMDTASLKTGDAKRDALIASLPAIVLEFKPDKTFAINVPGATQLGTFEVAGKVATLKLTSAGAAAADQPGTCTLADDGKSMTVSSTKSPAPVKFTKQAS